MKVFAGDKFNRAADATYKNLVWENLSPEGQGLAGVLKRNTEIGKIVSWGPQFRISFDLKINSFVSGNRAGWNSVIAFKTDGGASDRKIGDRIPAIFYNRRGYLHFTNALNGNINHVFDFKFKLKKWYSITIEQTWENEKVGEPDRDKEIKEILIC